MHMLAVIYCIGAAQKWFPPEVRGFVGSLGKKKKQCIL
jgi:hypothetical protein